MSKPNRKFILNVESKLERQFYFFEKEQYFVESICFSIIFLSGVTYVKGKPLDLVHEFQDNLE